MKKTKLLKLALCALTLLPLSTWADEIDFGEEVTVSNTTLWTFNDFSNEFSATTYTAIDNSEGVSSAYLRANGTRAFSIVDASEIPDFTLLDGTSVSISKGLHCASNIANASNLSITLTAGTKLESSDPVGFFAFNAEVAGTVYVYFKSANTSKTMRIYHSNYVSKGTALKGYELTITENVQSMAATSKAKGTFFISTAGTNMDIYAVYFVPLTEEPKITDATTWVFNGLDADSYTANKQTSNNGFIHASKSYPMSVTTAEGSNKFGDDTPVSWTKYLQTANAMQGRTSAEPYIKATAAYESAHESVFVPSFAFNAAVPGTCYAIMSTTSGKKLRIHFANGSSVVNSEATSSTDYEIKQLNYTSNRAGSFFVGGVEYAARIYAVRFVPLTRTVSIGSTGYATYGNNDACAYSLPAGLTVYAANASDGGHAVVLTQVQQMRPTQGYIVKGTPGETYTLTAAVDEKVSTTNSMKRVASAIEKFAYESDGKYRYILGNDNGTAKFFAPNGTSTLAAGKAYLESVTELTPAPGARALEIFFEEGETTAIQALENKTRDSLNFYNLNGQRVTNPSKGLYIVNGKKVIIK